jgi:D-3-phosphoglycerate dehydrogenase
VEVADHTMAMLLAIIRQIPQSIDATRRGAWSDDPKAMRQFQSTVGRIAGNVVGIIGFGNIGRAFATRVRGFGPKRVIAYDPYISQSAGDLFGVELVPLEELLAEADFITVHTPLTEETRHLINADTLHKMKPSAILLNCARGPIVDQVALHAALRDGVIAFAGIDVTEREPIDMEDPLLSLPNVFVTPHLAGYSPTFLQECGIKQAENVVRALTGTRPHGLANPDVIKTIAVMRAQGGDHRWAGTSEFSA